jgi:hypothetical protein
MASIVVFVLIWPIAHAIGVARFRVDPWEFFGWSMYAVPAARVQVRVELERAGEVQPLRAMGESRRLLQRFARGRTALGTLADTETLAREIMAADPTLDAVIVETREIRLDRNSARLVARDERHRHARANPSGAGS